MATAAPRDDLSAILSALTTALDFVLAAQKIGTEMDGEHEFVRKTIKQHGKCARKLLAVKMGLTETISAYDQLHAAAPSVVVESRLPPEAPGPRVQP